MKKPIIELIDQSSGLYAIPEICSLLNAKLKEPYASNAQISDIIQRDPGLTLTILKIVNSAFYGFESSITTVTKAITILGRNELTALVFGTSAVNVFSKLEIEKSKLYQHWQHSLFCGLLAKQLAFQTKQTKQVDNLFIAGLLHDIGRLIIWHKLPQESAALAQALKENPAHELTLEFDLLGFNHAELGAELMKLWKVPQLLIETTLWHHSPEQAIDYPLECQLIHIANNLAHFETLDHEIQAELEQNSVLANFALDFDTVKLNHGLAQQQMREMIGMFLT